MLILAPAGPSITTRIGGEGKNPVASSNCFVISIPILSKNPNAFAPLMHSTGQFTFMQVAGRGNAAPSPDLKGSIMIMPGFNAFTLLFRFNLFHKLRNVFHPFFRILIQHVDTGTRRTFDHNPHRRRGEEPCSLIELLRHLHTDTIEESECFRSVDAQHGTVYLHAGGWEGKRRAILNTNAPGVSFSPLDQVIEIVPRRPGVQLGRQPTGSFAPYFADMRSVFPQTKRIRDGSGIRMISFHILRGRLFALGGLEII
mmetsp:Transcript_8432/g.20650  ORF Transcript_8432/g.20650 Transcript_8432/m.20650 type:complete len:256 (-) Transcript_8432:768-1535(-)